MNYSVYALTSLNYMKSRYHNLTIENQRLTQYENETSLFKNEIKAFYI